MTEVQITKGPTLGMRHMQALLLFLAIVVQFIGRYNTSVAIVAMTKVDNTEFHQYNWTNKEVSYVLSGFFWGYVISCFPGSFLCRRFGAKTTLFVSTLGSAVFSAATPFLLPLGGWQVFVVIKLIQGLFQGSLFPCMHAHLALWCPVKERNRLGAISSTGQECGALMSILVSGSIASSSFGWPGIFYISGAIGVAWCILWIVFASNTPSESYWISNEERTYITSSLNQKMKGEKVKKIPIPWKAILTSMPFWAMFVAVAAECWGFSTLQAEIPLYMNGVLKMDLSSNTLFSSLPYLAMWIMAFLYWLLSEILLNRNILTLTTLRRTYNSVSFFIPAVGLIVIGFLDERHKTFAIILLIMVLGINAGVTIGCFLNTIDLSPNHAGILMGILNAVSSIVPIITPILIGEIVTDEHNRGQWQIVFAISAVIFIISNIFYITYGSTDLQPWNDETFLQHEVEALTEKPEIENSEKLSI